MLVGHKPKAYKSFFKIKPKDKYLSSTVTVCIVLPHCSVNSLESLPAMSRSIQLAGKEMKFGQLVADLRSMERQTLYLSLFGLLVTVFASRLLSGKSSKYKLPPRVPGIPIFGNALQVPPVQQGPWAKGLAEKYGEM